MIEPASLMTLFTSADEATCETTAMAMGQAGEPGMAILMGLLATNTADARFWAVRGLWANGSPQAVALLIEALNDPTELVRSGAALALGELQAEVAIEALARQLTRDPTAGGDHAGDALAKIGQVATAALIEALQHQQSWVRVRAAKALGQLESHKAIGPLFQTLEDESYLVRYYAQTALEKMGVGQMVYFWL